jgi:hypothetical protein
MTAVDPPRYSRSITFGSNHRGYAWYPKAHPDGWLVVEGPTSATVYDKIREMFFDGSTLMYAFDYEGDKPDSSWLYPLGMIERITVTEAASDAAVPEPLSNTELICLYMGAVRSDLEAIPVTSAAVNTVMGYVDFPVTAGLRAVYEAGRAAR